MLYLYFANMFDLADTPGYIRATDSAFRKYYPMYGKEQHWLQDPIVRECIQDVDRIVLGQNTTVSLAEAEMRPDDLCTGTKNIILCRFIDGMHRQTHMGENCYPYLFKIGAIRDLTLGCAISFFPKQEWLDMCPITVVNDGKVYTVATEFIRAAPWVWYPRPVPTREEVLEEYYKTHGRSLLDNI